MRADNGREYCNEEMQKYMSARGIVMKNTAPYTSEQNSRSERDNRTIVESARRMLLAKRLPKFLWAEAISTAIYTYILNRTTISGMATKVTPYEGQERSRIWDTRIFGTEAFALVPKQFTSKFDARAKQVLLVGYQGESKNCRLNDSKTRKVSVSLNVTFNERFSGATMMTRR